MLALRFKTHTIQEALREGVLALQKAKIETASLDSRLLLEYVLQLSREQLLMDIDSPVSAIAYGQYQQLIVKRAARGPMAQLLGKREFWGRNFKVTEATLDPRPDSETLIETVLSRITDKNVPLKILDLGTGSGCLLLTLLAECSQMQGIGADICPSALKVAKENALAHGLGARAEFIESNWFEKARGRFDIVISNPPYIATNDIGELEPEVALYEPKLALDGGADGLDAYRMIFSGIGSYMNEGAFAALEIGLGQSRELEALAKTFELKVEAVVCDLAGIPRVIILRKPKE